MNENNPEAAEPLAKKKHRNLQEELLPEKCWYAYPLKSGDEEPPSILIIHASVGSGHRTAANAIFQAFELISEDEKQAFLERLNLNNFKVEVFDMLDFGRIRWDGDKAASMFTGAGRPFYDLTWRYTMTGRLLWGGGTIWGRVFTGKFTEYVRQTKPLAIVGTHINSANCGVTARMVTGQDFPVVCVPTDYDVEGWWPHLHGDLFCVASEFMAETLRPRKVPEERILITGIPTSPAFLKTYDRHEIRSSMGLPFDKYLVLVLAGAYLPRPYVRFREIMERTLPYLHTFDNMHFIFIAGKDADYARKLRRQCDELKADNVTVLEYVENMAGLMNSSDLMITKSGGLTITEALNAQVPMILTGRAYGQEKANVNMLTSAGAALHVTTARELLASLRRINRFPDSTNSILVNASFLRHPHAADDIARATMRLIGKPRPTNDPLMKKHFIHAYWGHRPAHIR